MFVAVATSGNNQVMTSSDGITWTARAEAEANQWYSVCWSKERGLFVAVATSGTNRVMTSPDGITWTARAAAEANAWVSVCWSKERGMFVAVAFDGTNRVMTSPDGITWTARTAAEANSWLSVCWSPERGMFVAVAISGTNRVMTLDLAQLNASPIQNGQKEGQKLILVGTDNYNTPELKTVGNLDVQKDSSDSSIAVSYQQEYELNWDSINNQWIRVK
jgi:lipid-binding SYLF domain-containing protein